MKQIFSSYPDGITGLALVMLRGSAVAVLVTVIQNPHGSMPWLTLPAALIAAAIAIGFGTRPAVVLSVLIAGPVLLASRSAPTMLVIGQGLSLLGLLLLGPGAFSIDARLFGRRKISLTR